MGRAAKRRRQRAPRSRVVGVRVQRADHNALYAVEHPDGDYFWSGNQLWSRRHSTGLPQIPPGPIAVVHPETGQFVAVPR